MRAAASDEAMSGIWTVHSASQSRPMLRGFCQSQAEAEKLMANLKTNDEPSEEGSAPAEYWLVELSNGALADFRAFGMLPPGF